jgi:hypothetical protein
MTDDLKIAVQHVTARIAAAPVKEEPFPYLVAPDFLPDDLYSRMAAAWPDSKFFVHENSMRRKEMWVRNHWAELRPQQTLTWQLVARVLKIANSAILQRFDKYLGDKFAPYLGRKWSDHIKSLSLAMTGLQLASYRGTIGLPPHVDHARLITNAFLYCNERAGAELEQATVIYHSMGLGLPTNMNMAGTDIAKHLRVVDTIPYQANLCLAFLNTPRSFHGVDPHDIGDRERRLVIFNSAVKSGDAVRLFGEAAART